ncbi:hypothetical protein K1719_039935 [Acacia pycnantha]|nr:hypothetical protein K1719_039935 [Acacia pycnantha]
MEEGETLLCGRKTEDGFTTKTKLLASPFQVSPWLTRPTTKQEKLYQWIWKQQEGGSRVAAVDILNYIQVGFTVLSFAYDPSPCILKIKWIAFCQHKA